MNKVNTKAELRFEVDKADWLDEATRRKLKDICSSRMLATGELVLTSERTRSQQDNRQDCLHKLSGFISEAMKEPSEPTVAQQQTVRHHQRVHAQHVKLAKQMRAVKKGTRQLGRDAQAW